MNLFPLLPSPQELCYYAGVIVLYFFGDLFLALQGCGAGHDAGTVSCTASLLLASQSST